MSWRDLVREDYKGIEPYRVAGSDAQVRLDANEAPFELPRSAREAIARSLVEVALGRYPDILSSELRAWASRHHDVAPDGILFGNGSDELLALICATFARPRKDQSRARVCYPTPTFVMYRVGTLAAGSAPLEVPLRPDFMLDEVALERALVAGHPNVLFLARPNNPTGGAWPKEAIEHVAKTHGNVIVVVDEAYAMYAQDDCLDLMRKYENVLVMRTLSKIGLAALRVGYLLGHAPVIHEIERIRGPYNVGTLPQRVAAQVLKSHWDTIAAGVRDVVAERERVRARLEAAGATVFPSQANFLLVRHTGAAARAEQLKARGILVKNFDKAGTPLEGCLRVTIGLAAENDAFLTAYGEIAEKMA
jgi:histidinol-phosphate aminotransferase